MAMTSRIVPTLAPIQLGAAVAVLLCLLSCHSASAEVRLGIRPQLGIEAAAGTPSSEGLEIEAVEPKLPAARAGMVKGDLLLSLNGSPVRTALDVRAILVGMAPGQPLKIRFRHGSTVVDKEERPSDVPELPSYELLEGRGIKGSVMVGDTREQVEKTLGKPRAEGRRGSLISLDYPRHGIMVGLEPLDGKPRVMFVVVHFPFIGVTSRGLSTEGRRADILRVYRGERVESGADPGGNQNEALPGLGVLFMCRGDSIVGTVLLPAEPTAVPSPGPTR